MKAYFARGLFAEAGHKLVQEASVLGLGPGQVPESIVVEGRQYFQTGRILDGGEVAGWEYTTAGVPRLHLAVLND
jgi:hypothetical protein